ncbi:MAG: alcohol dehydrogenase catalytic domain-containing protein, partial [Planctomycetes bacterium]|nr:alcohol dehydrogenase catalytic domain-containing protein [Planctomycetota bacterium]
MKTGLLDKADHIVIAEAPCPKPGPGEVLLKTRFAGVCGSDLHAYKGLHPFRKPPVVLGHEISGHIEEIGPGVSGFAMGDAVTVMPALGCGECRLCRQGRTNICLKKKVPGAGGWLGTFAEYFAAPAAIVYKLPAGMGLDVAVLAEPLATSIHSAKVAGVGKGDQVLIVGGGTIGILAVAAAFEQGARDVAVTDVLDFNLNLARDSFGADPWNALDQDLEQKLLAKYPDKFDSVILCANAESTMHQSIRLVRRGGTVVVAGMYLEPINFCFLDITLGEIAMAGTQIYTDPDFREALRML